MDTPSSYNIIRLPKSLNRPPVWKTLVAKQKALRLRSLLISPESFSSTYEREAAFTDVDWEARLQNPSAYTLIAMQSTTPRTAHNADKADDDPQGFGTDSDYLDGEWVGSIVLVGPQEKSGSGFATFDLCALFVLPEAWGTGLGAALVQNAVSEAQRLTPGASKVFIKASVARGNERVLRLYERAGFVERDAAREAGLTLEARVLVKELNG